jgi:uncharacterized protein involved in outer membrane biogenesis
VKILVRVLLLLALLFALPIGAIVLLQPEFDLGDRRVWLGDIASRIAGREVRLEGDVKVALGRHARLSVEALSVQNPDWAEQASLFEAESTSVVIDLADLLTGTLAFEQIRLINARIGLQQLADGRRSWSIRTADDGAKPPDDDKGRERHWRWRLEGARLENVVLHYVAPGRRYDLALARLRQHDDAGSLLIDAAGDLNGLALGVAGRVGTLDNLLDSADIDLDLSLSLDDTVLRAKGRLGDPDTLEDITLSIALQGPELARITSALGLPYTHHGEIDARLDIVDRDQGWNWDGGGRIGTLQFSSRGALDDPDALDGLRGNIDVSGQSLSLLAAAFGLNDMPEQPYQLRGEFGRQGPRLFAHGFQFTTGKDRLELNLNIPAYPTAKGTTAELAVAVMEPQRYAGNAAKTLPISGPLNFQLGLEAVGERGTLAAEGAWGEHRVAIEGLLSDKRDLAGSHVDLELAGPDLPIGKRTVGGQSQAQPYRLPIGLGVNDDGQATLALGQGSIGSARLAANGVLGSLPDLAALDVGIEIRDKSLREALARFVPGKFPDQPFSIETRLKGPIQSPVLVDAVGKVGETRLETTGRLALVQGLIGSDIRFRLAAVELRDWLQLDPGMVLDKDLLHASGRLRASADGISLEGVSISGERIEASLSATMPADGTLQGLNLRVNAETSSLALLLPPSDRYQPPDARMRADINLASDKDGMRIETAELLLDDAKLTVSGRLQGGESGITGEMTIDAAVPRLASLGTVAGVTWPKDALQLNSRVAVNRKRVVLDALQARLGNAAVDGRIVFEQRERPFIDVKLEASAIDLREFYPPGDKEPTAFDAREVETAEEKQTDAPIRLDALRRIDARLDLTGQSLFIPDPNFEDRVLVSEAHLFASIEDGKLSVEQLQMRGDRGSARIKGHLDAQQTGISTAWQLQTTDLRFGLSGTSAGLDSLPPHEIQLKVSTNGSTRRELIDALQGSLLVVGGTGQTTNTNLDDKLGPFTEDLVTRLNPFVEREAQTGIGCSAAAVTLEAGVLKLEPGIVIRSDKIDTAANGTIDLKTGRVDVQFHSAPRKGLGISAAGLVRPFIKVGGTLQEPAIVLDAANALVAGAAAVATGGVSLLATSVLDRVSTTGNPCEAVIEQAKQGASQSSLGRGGMFEGLLRLRGQKPVGSMHDEDQGTVLDLIE